MSDLKRIVYFAWACVLGMLVAACKPASEPIKPILKPMFSFLIAGFQGKAAESKVPIPFFYKILGPRVSNGAVVGTNFWDVWVEDRSI